ncbi:type II toxin-antitoxin system RelE/ParE family toxin [Mucilaginibacter sp. UR6-1]|uniref:type II toxin-antitoxin system RelE/ParE family toxin n=1 Tax=Mucilaginibacter sp. UR6-1 TaxID=1435643 RepID=UPI001E458D02|nr:type II toxin-antitoxin system RelE/ParE family toxin [Mucilaginibacter sp. UR6-1]MCC8408737.1 type II toxin-antitoxin system RelE/ParE family toxin [Mucilaginibacter sp. UR6-1]
MKAIISERALSTIDSIARFVESQNTKGSGARYALKFKEAIKKLAIPNVQYTLCNHKVFLESDYSCSHFNDWVIAFRIDGNKLVVYEIVHGSLLA